MKERYEAHHKVSIADTALVAAATLSDRYITGRSYPTRPSTWSTKRRPGCGWRSTPARSRSTSCAAVDRLQMEEMALEREQDAASRERLTKLRAEQADRDAKLNALEERWQNEKQIINRVGEMKEQIDEGGEIRLSKSRAAG